MTVFRVLGVACNFCPATITSSTSGDDPTPLIDKMHAEGWRWVHADRTSPRIDWCPECGNDIDERDKS